MKITLCNEVLLPMSLAEQCAFARAVGYDGLEIAPLTRIVESQGLLLSSLHWLAMAREGLDLTSLDPNTSKRTREALFGLVELAARLSAPVMVYGSPAQRRLGGEPDRQRAVAMAHSKAAAKRADEYGIVYSLEAINFGEGNFLNTLAEADAMIEEIGVPALKLTIDVSQRARISQGLVSRTRVVDAGIEAGFVYPMEGPGLGSELQPTFFERADLMSRASAL